MLTALCKASAALQDQEYKEMAASIFQFIVSKFTNNESEEMLHTFKDGIAKFPAFLDDYKLFY